MNNWKRNTTTALAVTLGLSLALITAPVNAGSQGNKKGPQASVEVATRCTLNVNGSLDVNVIVTDTSSGSVKAYLDDVSITPVYKGATKGNHTNPITDLAEKCDSNILVGDEIECNKQIDLCAALSDEDLLDPDSTSELDSLFTLRAINTDVIVNYGTSATDVTKTVSNNCTDDPITDDFEGGIYINHAELYAACNPPPPAD